MHRTRSARPRRILGLVAALCLLAGASAAHAQDAAAGDVTVTVYSTNPAAPANLVQQYGNYGYYDPYAYGGYGYQQQGYGVVREVRNLDLQSGENELRYSDVPARIDATTVQFRSLRDPEGTFVVEQNFEYDLVSADKILQRYIDAPITLHTTGDGELRGDLLSYDGNRVVLDTGASDGPIQIVNIGATAPRISMDELPGGLITKPTLMWQVDAKQAGDHDVEVSYQTNGLAWNADYNVVLADDDKSAEVGAWVTLENASGRTFENAKLKLVAGDVQRVANFDPYAPMGGYGVGSSRTAAYDTNNGFSEESFYEYHLYTLGRTTTLKNNATKQVELFSPATGVPVAKTYVYRGYQGYNYTTYGSYYLDEFVGTANTKVDVAIQFENDETSGLGIPMPAGRMRLYKRNPNDGSLEFVGEDVVDHTPRNEKVRVKTGSAFDIVGEWKITNFEVDYNAKWLEETIEVKLRNQKRDEDVTVSVVEELYRWVNWEIKDGSHPHEKDDARHVRFDVKVPKDGGETVVTYTARYTW